MTDKRTKFPKIRFKNYTDAWEQRKLAEVADYRNGKAHEQDIDDAGKYIVVNSKFVSTNGKVKKYTKTMIEPLMKGELAFVLSDVPNGKAIARTFLINENDSYSLNQRIAGITPYNDTDSYFLNILMNRNKYFLKFDNGVGQTNLSKSDVEEFYEHYPSYEEQTQIGTFFTTLDRLLALHQRKLESLKIKKQSYLQKMFPKNGSDIPELRFAGFTDAWEQRKLNEIAERFDNLRVPITASERISGETPYYGANGLQDYVEGFTHDGEFVLVAEDGANDLQNYPVQYVNGRVWVNNHAHVIQGKEYVANNKFLMNSIKNLNIEPFLVGGGRAKLNADVMMKLQINIPSLEEQSQIGTFFTTLDNLITLHQRELETLKNMKKSLLKQMFV